MAEKTYTYHGPLSAVTLPADDTHPHGRHVQLFPGRDVTLPDDNAYVQALAARKHLAPVETPATVAAPSAPTPKADTATAPVMATGSKIATATTTTGSGMPSAAGTNETMEAK